MFFPLWGVKKGNMRSIKNSYVDVLGCKLYSGRYYLLEFPCREEYREYIFEFDSVSYYGDGRITIYHRGKWIGNGDIFECNGVEGMVTIPCGEDIKLRRYRGNKIDLLK